MQARRNLVLPPNLVRGLRELLGSLIVVTVDPQLVQPERALRLHNLIWALLCADTRFGDYPAHALPLVEDQRAQFLR